MHNITLTQLAVLLPSFAVVAWLFDRTSAVSFAAGAAVSILPQAWFAVLVFGFRQRRSLLRAARGAYAAHAGKFLLSAAGFALVFALLRPVSAPAVFAGFGIMWTLQTVGSARLLRAGY
ncbi:ATP synthase subunit I [Chromatocurvus halotolerans]|uniref:ATP synthase subunit I n=1 Tax=Chromatocurvus halotolerans TaxID=1132028 RepID=UPI0013C3401C|nr:ATP synthase subunit I [Chromatocurvus halotolerans]